jgi:hypothetical protein
LVEHRGFFVTRDRRAGVATTAARTSGRFRLRQLLDRFVVLKQHQYLAYMLKAFEKDCGTEQPHLYLYDACRTAVAHAKPRKRQAYDPDNLSELRRLHVAADFLRELAKLFIQNELHVSGCGFDGS